MPRKPRADTPARGYPVRLSTAERHRIAAAARVNRQRFAEFCRDALLEAADECLEDEHVSSFPNTKSQSSLTL
jgi:uncharacterized protein (DUF1778 family)